MNLLKECSILYDYNVHNFAGFFPLLCCRRGGATEKYSWQSFTVFMLVVLNNFIIKELVRDND